MFGHVVLALGCQEQVVVVLLVHLDVAGRLQLLLQLGPGPHLVQLPVVQLQVDLPLADYLLVGVFVQVDVHGPQDCVGLAAWLWLVGLGRRPARVAVDGGPVVLLRVGAGGAVELRLEVVVELGVLFGVDLLLL